MAYLRGARLAVLVAFALATVGLLIPEARAADIGRLAPAPRIATGQYHTCALTSDGRAFCWGGAAVGNGTPYTVPTATPTAVTMPTGKRFTQIVAGNGHSCALASDGTAWCWGDNTYGQVGSPSAVSSILLPTEVSGGHTFVQIVAGFYHACGLEADGDAFCWGDNFYGQLGDGSLISRYSPVLVDGGKAFTQLGAGPNASTTCGLTVGGSAWCWGAGIEGQLGNYNQQDSRVPVEVVWSAALNQADGFVQIATGSAHTCALGGDGDVWCWGDGFYGEFGDGTNAWDVIVPRLIFNATGADASETYVQLVLAGNNTCGVTRNGAVRCWGDNSSGQLGDGTTTSSNVPVAVSGLSGVTQVAIGGYHGCALTAAGALHCWGSNGTYAVGDGTLLTRMTPVSVSLTQPSAFTNIASGPYAFVSCALDEDGAAWCWGWNDNGEIGDGTTTTRYVPTAVSMPSGKQFVQLAAGWHHTCGLAMDGTIWCWGDDAFGQLGDGGAPTDSLTPVEVSLPALPSGARFVQISAGSEHTCGITTVGAAWCWGDNDWGQLGDGTTVDRSVPTAVSGGKIFAQLAVGRLHTCGLSISGAAWCWGAGGSGRLGIGYNTAHLDVPTEVIGGKVFAQLVAGTDHNCGLASDGSAWCWGYNQEGQVGDGSKEDVQSPTAVTGGKVFTALSAGGDRSCGRTASGVVWCWGANGQGQIGDGTTTERLTPTSVSMPSGITFARFAAGRTHTCALGGDGTLWCWGWGTSGQVGLGSPAPASTLVPTSLTSVTVTKSGSGSGTVTSAPTGIDCGSACSASFAWSQTVTLSATASDGYTFVGWSGEGCSGTSTCVVTTSRTRSVTATFSVPVLPTQPTSLSWASADGGGGVSLSWVAPSDGDATITSYDVRYSASSAMTSPTVVTGATTGSPASTTYTKSSLTNATTYYFQVRAVNSVGPSAWGPTTPIAAIPGTPAGITSVTPVAGNAQVALSWSAPATNGAAISGYDVRSSTSAAMTSPTTASTTTPSYTRTGLVNGTTYYFQVRAKNTRGAGPWGPATPASATPFTVPSQPTSLSWDTGATSVALTWTAPANKGSTITDYNVRYSTSSTMTSPVTVPSATSGNPAGTSYTQTGLSAGTTYYFQVQAKNAAGVSTWGPTTPVAAIVGTPAALASLDAVRGNVSVALSWSAPADNGSAITAYDVRRAATAAMTSPTTVALGNVTSYTWSGLVNGTTYYFQVRAKSTRGAGPWGPVTPSSATPATVPGKQSAPTVRRDGFGSVKVSATVVSTVAATGGSSITSYTFTSVQDATKTCTATLPATSCSVSGLTTGASYTFTATATNVVGTSVSASIASVAVVAVGRTDFSSNASVTSATQLNLTPNTGGAVPIGARLLISYAADTASASTPAVASVTFPDGGAATCTLTYGGFAPTSGATAGSGIRAGIVYCNVTTQIPANARVRLTLSATPASAIAIGEYLVGFASGGTVSTTTVTRGVATAPTITGASVAAGYLVVGFFAYEDNAIVDADADSGGGSTWSSATNLQNSGSGLTALTVFRQMKWVSVAAAPTYNTATATPASADWLAGLLSIR